MTFLTFEPRILVHPVPNDGPQEQHGACHNQAIHRRQQQAVSIQLHEKDSYGKVPHSVTLLKKKKKRHCNEVFVER